MDPAISVSDLKRYAESWILSCEIGQHSASTLANRLLYLRKFFWFLENKAIACCSVLEMRQFFAYLTNGHKEPEGRWGRACESQPVKPSTVATYHRYLGTLKYTWRRITVGATRGYEQAEAEQSGIYPRKGDNEIGFG
jgi:hypothetical protein